MMFRTVVPALIVALSLGLSACWGYNNRVSHQPVVTYISSGVHDFSATCGNFDDQVRNLEEIAGDKLLFRDTLARETGRKLKRLTDTLRFSATATGGLYYPRARYTIAGDTFCLVPNWVSRDTDTLAYVPVYSIIKNDSLMTESSEIYCIMKRSLLHFRLAPETCVRYRDEERHDRDV